jgi:hypothetical protein
LCSSGPARDSGYHARHSDGSRSAASPCSIAARSYTHRTSLTSHERHTSDPSWSGAMMCDIPCLGPKLHSFETRSVSVQWPILMLVPGSSRCCTVPCGVRSLRLGSRVSVRVCSLAPGPRSPSVPPLPLLAAAILLPLHPVPGEHPLAGLGTSAGSYRFRDHVLPRRFPARAGRRHAGARLDDRCNPPPGSIRHDIIFRIRDD